MLNHNEDELEYLVPAPVLTQADKLFNFGPIRFSLAEMVEFLSVLGLCFGVWQLLGFLPTVLKIIVCALVTLIGFIFITQPINGLPGDVWVKYSLIYYLFARRLQYMIRRGRQYIKVRILQVTDQDQGRKLVEMIQHEKTEEQYGFL